jgi:hypothetical protein
MTRPLLRHLLKCLFSSRPRRPASRRSARPRLEVLEERTTPSFGFAAQQTFAAGSQPIGVAAADVNGDGRPDIVTVNSTTNTVSVLLNTTAAGATSASFAPQQTFPTGTGPYAVAVADVNDDGRPDLITANYAGGSGATVSVLLNTTPAGASTPSFAAKQDFATGAGPSGVAAVDLNGDGRPDLAVANRLDNTVSVLLNTTPTGAMTTSFADHLDFATGLAPISVAVADLNGDGRPDLAVSNNGFPTVSLLVNAMSAGAKTASFAARQDFSTLTSPTQLVLADINGDGRPDIVVAGIGAGSGPTPVIAVRLNITPVGQASLGFSSPEEFTVDTGPFGVAVADVDGDGRPDVITTNFNGADVSVLLSHTSVGGSSSFAPHVEFNTGTAPLFSAVSDFNGDGRPDLVTANSGDGMVSVLLNTTTPFAVTTPAVVADFKGYGLYQYNQSTSSWLQLHPLDPYLLAVNASGEVVADFVGYGLYTYTNASGWMQINGYDATAVALDSRGDVAASFPGHGTYLHQAANGAPYGWAGLHPLVATQLALDGNGNVYAVFPGYGLYEDWLASGWVLLNGYDPVALAVNAGGTVASSFPGFGTSTYTLAGGWRALSGAAAQQLAIDANGAVTANFSGYGSVVFREDGTWQPLGPVALAVDSGPLADRYAVFAGFGLWRYDPARGWVQLWSVDAALLAVA